MLSKMLVLAMPQTAAWAASLRIAGILPFVTTAFQSGCHCRSLLPALVAGIFWRRHKPRERWQACLPGRQSAPAAIITNLRRCSGRWDGTGHQRRAGSTSTRWPPGCSGSRQAFCLVVVSLMTTPPAPSEVAVLDQV